MIKHVSEMRGLPCVGESILTTKLSVRHGELNGVEQTKSALEPRCKNKGSTEGGFALISCGRSSKQ